MTAFRLPYTLPHAFRTAGAGISEDQPYPWPVMIGGVGFVLDLAHYTRTPPDAFRAAQDNGAEPGEQSLNPRGSWKRNRTDWTLGTGQVYADDDGVFGYKSTPRRFYASKGIDALSTPRQFSMLSDTALARASANSSLQVLTAGIYAYMVDGSSIYYSTDLASWTAVALGGAHSSNATSDGGTVWVAVAGAGIKKSTAGSGSVALIGNQGSTFIADHLAFVNGWLIATKGAQIAEVAQDGTMTGVSQLNYTHPSAGWKWVGIAGAPNGIYAAGYVGDYSAIYFIGVNSSGALTVPVLAGELARGELAQSLAYYGQRLFIGTSQGFHVAEILTGDGLAPGPLVKLSRSVQCAIGQSAFVYFGWSNYDGISSGLGRARLDEFVAPDVPGYQSDLMAATQGTVSSVAVLGGVLLFTVDGVGTYRQHATNLVASATLDTGWFTFGVFEQKAYASVEVATAPLDGSVSVAMIDQHGNSTQLGVLSHSGTTNDGQALPTGGLSGDQARVQLTLTRAAGDATKGPVVRRITVRALPKPANIPGWTLPVVLTEYVDVGPDHTIKAQWQDVAGKLQFLDDLVATQRTVNYQEGRSTRRVFVRHVSMPEGFAKGWVPRKRDAIMGTYAVELVGIDVGN